MQSVNDRPENFAILWLSNIHMLKSMQTSLLNI